jgi:hypothetical protein
MNVVYIYFYIRVYNQWPYTSQLNQYELFLMDIVAHHVHIK